jgi:hypothetical protein
MPAGHAGGTPVISALRRLRQKDTSLGYNCDPVSTKQKKTN